MTRPPIYKFILFSFFLITMCACNDKDNENKVPLPPLDEVTYLFYMVGENDLAELLNKNVTDMMVGIKKSNINANILVYSDITSRPELYLIKKENNVVKKTTVKSYPNQYSVDPDVMSKVIRDIFNKYPAKKYAITFSSHASGSLYDENTIRKRSFGYEGDNGYTMNITDIKKALFDIPKLELIMFDACMMSSIETAYEFKDIAKYMLAAPNSVPGKGFPYDKIMPSLLKLNKEGISEAADQYFEYFSNNEEEWDDFASICASDLTNMDSLALYMDSLFQDDVVSRRPATLTRYKLQNFEIGFHLYDFGNWLDTIGKDSRYLEDVKRVLNKVVVYKNHGEFTTVDDYTGELGNAITPNRFSGFNTYVPSTNINKEGAEKSFFTTLQWYKDAGFWRSPFYSEYE